MDSSNPEPEQRDAEDANAPGDASAASREANGLATDATPSATSRGARTRSRTRSRRPPAADATEPQAAPAAPEAEAAVVEAETAEKPAKKTRTRRKKAAEAAPDEAASTASAEAPPAESAPPPERRRRSRRPAAAEIPAPEVVLPPPPSAPQVEASSAPSAAPPASPEAPLTSPEAAAAPVTQPEPSAAPEPPPEAAPEPPPAAPLEAAPIETSSWAPVTDERSRPEPAQGDAAPGPAAEPGSARRPGRERRRDREDRDRDRDRDRERERDRDRDRDRDSRAALGPNDLLSGPGPRPAIHRRAFPSEHLDEDALKVLRRLHRNGYRAYLVGGCVRDLLLGRKAKDFDVATSARPHEVKSLFRNCRVIGRRFRLAHIIFGGGKVIETATFRRDPTASADEETYVGEVDPSLAFDEAGSARMREALDSGEMDVVSVLRPIAKPRDDDADLLIRNDNVFGEPHEDALRRDFTINGLFYDVERGEVIDYVGGLRDLERRAINTIGLPDVRFREDPVRILRAIKFSARLDLGIDPDVYDAMVAQREELLKAAKPRLLEEILRLLRGGAAHRSIWLAWEIGVLSVVLPELAVFLDDDAPRSRLLWGRLDAIDACVRHKRVPSDSVLLAALLLGPIEEAIEGAKDPSIAYEDFMHAVNESLAVPRRMKERMRAIIGSQRRLRAGRHAAIARRDFFAEAVQLFELECAARGQKVPDLRAEVVDHGGAEGETVVRRRRRRRRR